MSYAPAMLGVMTAMPEEIESLLGHARVLGETLSGGRRFVEGELFGHRCAMVFSRWGKVAAASTATQLIVRHGVTRVVFSGIAGALDPALRIGDVVVARSLVHHDLDASPFFPPGEIPLLNASGLMTDPAMTNSLLSASHAFLREAPGLWEKYSGDASWYEDPRGAVIGDLASGDQLVTTVAQRSRITGLFPSVLAVEMEGAAVAQVCHEHSVAFACVRAISDTADHASHSDLRPFFDGLAGDYTLGILRRWLEAQAPAAS